MPLCGVEFINCFAWIHGLHGKPNFWWSNGGFIAILINSQFKAPDSIYHTRKVHWKLLCHIRSIVFIRFCFHKMVELSICLAFLGIEFFRWSLKARTWHYNILTWLKLPHNLGTNVHGHEICLLWLGLMLMRHHHLLVFLWTTIFFIQIQERFKQLCRLQ